MFGLVLYRSFYGTTRQVAVEIATELEKAGFAVEVRDVREKIPDMHKTDFVFIGSPTRMGRASRSARKALGEIALRRYAGKPVAVFDTFGPVPADPSERSRAQSFLVPGAAGLLSAQARELGLSLYPRVLRCEVLAWKGPLKEGEAERARQFAREFRTTLLAGSPLDSTRGKD